MNENLLARTVLAVDNEQVTLEQLIESWRSHHKAESVTEAETLSEPYTLDTLPDDIKAVLPEGAQEIYVAAFNSAFEQYDGDEAKAHGTAWAAVKNKYEKGDDGKWHLKEGEMAEAVMKKEGAESFPASAYLVVEDPEEVTTWHLRVRDADGEPDRRLMGGAWAALHQGYRGQKYEGPDKQKAIDKLKAMYKAEDAELPEVDVDDIMQKATALKEALETVLKTEEVEDEFETVELAESLIGVEVLSEGATPDDGQGPLTLKVKLIEPGFGNKAKNHYYPADMLRRDARMFVGAKMHESDHGKDKSTRNWVSTVTNILGFTDTGAPIAEVLVHDPDFAQRARNLRDGNLLKELPCSILAQGDIKKGQKIDGREANIVERIVSVANVDWVTKAGAGGQALEIAENEPQEEKRTMENKDVLKVLLASHLPKAAMEKLAEGEYEDEEGLRAAIKAEGEYIAATTDSGKPFGMNSGQKPKDDKTLAERESAVLQKYGIGR